MSERLSENLMGERDRLIDERDKLQSENAKLKAELERVMRQNRNLLIEQEHEESVRKELQYQTEQAQKACAEAIGCLRDTVKLIDDGELFKIARCAQQTVLCEAGEMKLASEWVKDSEGTWDADYVRIIQADAIEYIARMVGDDRKMNRFPTDAMAIMEEARKLREWKDK